MSRDVYRFGSNLYNSGSYDEVAKVLAAELIGGEAIARRLLQRFVDVSIGEGVDPFKPLRGQDFEPAI